MQDKAIPPSRVQENTVNDISIIFTDAQERDFVVSAPVWHTESQKALVVGEVWESSKDWSHLLDKEILEIPRRVNNNK